MANEDRPLIKSVDGKYCPPPSSFTWGLQDNSASDAGRVEDDNDTMYKNRTSQKRKLSLGWQNLTPETTAYILQLFNPEYIDVEYFDAKECKEITKEFYSGDKSAPVKQWYVGGERYSLLSFDIIER